MITTRAGEKYLQQYVPTKFEFTKDYWKAMHGKKATPIQKNKVDELRDIEKRAEDIANKITPFDFDSFKKKYLNADNSNKLSTVFNEYVNRLRNEGRVGTAVNYKCALVSIEKFKKDVLLSEITKGFLKDYESWMEKEGNSQTTIGMYVRALRAVINIAMASEDFKAQHYPFGKGGHKPPNGVGNKRWLSEETLEKLYNYSGTYEKAKDFWFFSYFACGMNFKDIARLRYSDIDTEKNIISYHRAKTIRTKKESLPIKVDYTEDMKRIVGEYGIPGNGYIFDILEENVSPEREMQLVQQFIHVTNNDLKEIAKYLKIQSFTTYSARHSWATIQMNEDLSTTAISKLLGHADTKTTESYLGSLNVKTIKLATANANSFKNKKAKVVSI